MKKTVLGALCLLMLVCSVNGACCQENCFVMDTEVTSDMQKIHSILMKYFRTLSKKQTEYDLKFVKITCKLFGKNNKLLNKEIDKLRKDGQSEEQRKEILKLEEDLEKSLEGLKLDYKQVILLAKELEADCAEISKEDEVKLAPYKTRVREIMKCIDDQNLKKDERSFDHCENDLNRVMKFIIHYKLRDILNGNYDKFSVYSSIIDTLDRFISKDVLKDSFLKAHPSPIHPKDESSFAPRYSLYSLDPITIEDGEIIFDAARRAASNKKINKRELANLVARVSVYMKELAFVIVKIQNNVADKINHDTLISSYNESKLKNFYDFIGTRYTITNLIDKNPKFEDFDREIDKLSTRIAYRYYYKVNIIRFLYKEWRDKYYSQVKEFFGNAVKVADKLQEMTKDDVITDSISDECRSEYRNNAKNISNIKEIAKIGVDKIVSVSDCYTDSQEEIKESIRKSFLATREAYLRNLGQ